MLKLLGLLKDQTPPPPPPPFLRIADLSVLLKKISGLKRHKDLADLRGKWSETAQISVWVCIIQHKSHFFLACGARQTISVLFDSPETIFAGEAAKTCWILVS